MSETNLLLAEIQKLKREVRALQTVTEHPGFAASDVARLSQNNTFAGIQTIPNTGLHILDTNASHGLIIAPGSNLTADRTLTVTTGDANRTLTITGNATINQDVSTAGSPAFAGLTVDTNTLYVDAANNRVGFLTTAPGSLLSNVAAASLDSNITANGIGWVTANTDNYVVYFKSAKYGIYSRVVASTGSAIAGVFSAEGGTTNYGLIVTNGNVGFGTAVPSNKLAVESSSASTTWSDNIVLSLSNTDTTNNNWATLGFGQQVSGYHAAIGAQMTDRTPGTRDSDLAFFTIANNSWSENMRIKSTGNVGIGTTVPTNLLSFGGNAARIVWMERHTTSNTAGNSLTVQAGGATSGATDKAGGDLLLKPGDSTGSAESGVQIFGVVAGASGTADRTQTKGVQVLGNKIGFFAVTPVVRPTALTAALTALTHTAPGTPDYALQNLAAGGFGFATADEGNTMLSVLVRTALRLGEMEGKLQALGLLT